MQPAFVSALSGLPHRAPFVFVDEVIDLSEGSAECVKTFEQADPMFQGHFPGEPIVPGVILAEALAQTAGIAGSAGRPGCRFLLSAIRNLKFPDRALPNEQIRLFARKAGEMGPLWMFEVRATVGIRTVAEGQIVLNQRS